MHRLAPSDKEILNADGAAEVLGVSTRLVLRLAREGQLRGLKVGREWRFIRSDLRASITGGAEAGTLENMLAQLGAKVVPRREG